MSQLDEGIVTEAAIKAAIESRDSTVLANFYTDDAAIKIIDRNNPPSRPREISGKHAIATYFDDICSRAITHDVATSVANSNRLAFTQACTYPNGTQVFCLAIVELDGGKITRQTIVQAWDE